MDVCAFDTQQPDAPDELLWGFIELGALRSVSGRVRCFVAGDDVAGLSIDGADSPRGATTLVYLTMYRLPEADEALARDLKATHRLQHAWPLPGGRPFDPSMLAPRDIPPRWQHKAVQIVSTGRGILHAWRGGRGALVMRYVLQHGDLLTHPLFEWAVNDLRVATHAWRLNPPIPPRRRDLELKRLPRAGAAGAVPLEQPLDANERAEVAINAQRARNVVGIADDAPPEETLRRILATIDQWRPQLHTFAPNVRQNFAVNLALLWGEMIVHAFGWQWCWLSCDPAERFMAVVSPDRAYVASPIDFMTAHLAQPSAETDNAVRLLFGRIRDGRLPKSHPRAYAVLH